MLEPPLRVPVGNCWGRHPVASLDGTMFLLGEEDPQIGCRVACFDRNGSLQWERWYASPDYPFARIGPLRLAQDDTLWLCSANRIYRVVPPSHPQPLPLDLTTLVRGGEGERVGTFLVLPDGFLVTLDHPANIVGLPLTPRLARLDPAGNVRWCVELPVHPGDRFTGSALEGLPETWSADYAQDPLLLAGRHVLASFVDVRSAAERSYCLDVTTGALLWTEEGVAGLGKAIAGPDRFLLNGSVLYSGSGRLQHWGGLSGCPVIGRDDQAISLVQERNVSPPHHFWLLHRNGSAQRGPQLPGRSTSYPVLTTGGQTLFWRDGILQMIGADLRKEVLVASGSLPNAEVAGGRWCSRLLLLPDGTLACNISRYKDNVSSSELVLVRSDYRLASGWWPCGEGGLGGNPVIVAPPDSLLPETEDLTKS